MPLDRSREYLRARLPVGEHALHPQLDALRRQGEELLGQLWPRALATCFKLSDKHKLLGVIETGAGSLHHFNMQVRTLFRDGKRGSILRAPSLTRKSTKTAGEITRSLDDEVKV